MDQKIVHLQLKNTIVQCEYFKFFLKNAIKNKLMMRTIYETFNEIPGIITNTIEHLYMSIEVKTTCDWILNTFGLNQETRELITV